MGRLSLRLGTMSHGRYHEITFGDFDDEDDSDGGDAAGDFDDEGDGDDRGSVVGVSSGSVAIDLVYRQVMGLKQDMNRISGGCAALRMRTDVATRMIRGQEFPSVFVCLLL